MTTTYVNWGESTVQLTWKPGDDYPTESLITSVHGICFYQQKLLLVNLNDRGWDIPGGHIELDETTIECMNRETMEEGYVEGKSHLLGYIIVDHHENPNWNENSPYPKVGYQLFYRMDIEKIHPFIGGHEASERLFINPEQINDYYPGWHELYQAILDEALILNNGS